MPCVSISLLRDLLFSPPVHELFWSQSLLWRVFYCHSVSRELLAFLSTFVGLCWGTGTCSAEAVICVYLTYRLLLSHHVSSNYTVLDGCQQEKDKTYSTIWDGREVFLVCEERFYPALLANVWYSQECPKCSPCSQELGPSSKQLQTALSALHKALWREHMAVSTQVLPAQECSP